ncbi:MAG: hypothetical protein WDM90_20790 [Ferruginibacter sp.]
MAKYNAVHFDVDIALTLYAASTYELIERSGSFIPSKSVTKGAYLISDSSITLYTKKIALFIFQIAKQIPRKYYRIKGKHILLYSEAQEFSKDGNFIKSL